MFRYGYFQPSLESRRIECTRYKLQEYILYQSTHAYVYTSRRSLSQFRPNKKSVPGSNSRNRQLFTAAQLLRFFPKRSLRHPLEVRPYQMYDRWHSSAYKRWHNCILASPYTPIHVLLQLFTSGFQALLPPHIKYPLLPCGLHVYRETSLPFSPLVD